MARKEKLYHFIYKTTNLVNKKFYIGMHSTDNLDDGYLGSGNRLRHSIRKYGEENFRFDIIEFLSDRSSLKEREKKLVNENLLKDPLCMNLMVGGEGGFISMEIIHKAALASNESRRKRLKTDLVYLKKCQDNAIKSFSKTWNNGGPNKSGNSFRNKHHTKQTIERLKISHIGKHIGILNSQYGTCWITNGKENKKVKRENLVLEKDWYLGRI